MMTQAGALTTVCLEDEEKISEGLWEVISLNLPPNKGVFFFCGNLSAKSWRWRGS